MAYQPRKLIACTVCAKPAIARRLCNRHYYAERRAGRVQSHVKLGPEDVFDGRYKVMPSGCWVWTGTTNEFGYGLIMLPGTDKQTRAHRYSFERTKGKIPRGKVLRHSCDNPPCVNPDHLLPGTRLDNNRDAAERSRMPRGVRHWNARLTDEQVQQIKSLAATEKQNTIAARFGVSQSQICRIVAGRRRAKM